MRSSASARHAASPPDQSNGATKSGLTLGTRLLRLQKMADGMAATIAANDVDDMGKRVEKLRSELRLVVSQLDALRRVNSARILPVILYKWTKNHYPGSTEVSCFPDVRR